MNTNTTYKGVFWIPGEHKNEKNGLLKFLNETAYVDLFDSFDKDPLSFTSKRRTEICCIHGFLDNGSYCTLNKCQLSISGGFGGLPGTLINFEYIFYSSNRDLIERETEFSQIEFKLNTLFHWGGANSIESFRNKDSTYGLNYKKTNDPDFIFGNDKYELRLHHTTSIPLTTNQKSLLIEQDTSLVLKLKSNEDILDDFDFIEKIHDLFILFHADKVEMNSTFQLTTSEKKKYVSCYSNRKRFRKSKAYQSHEFGNLFTYIELTELTNVNDLFNLWFLMRDTLSYPIELITSCLSDISMSSQHKFMSLIYALEYITVKDLDNEMAKVYYANADQKILDEIEKLIKGDNSINQKNFLESLKTRLSKNRKLSDKFGSFLEQLSLPIMELFGEEQQIFVEKVVNTRNHFAHVNNKGPRIETEDLYLYNIKIEAILVFIFYLKLGLPFEKIKVKIRMHDRFQRVIK